MSQATAPAPDVRATGSAAETAVVTGGRRELTITGMTCASCVWSVESALRGIPGVEAADVNLASERASVRLDPARVAMPSLVRAVERAGYGALAVPEDELERAEADAREAAHRSAYVAALRTRLIAAAALAAAVMVLSMGDLVVPALRDAGWRPFAQFALATPVQLWAAAPFYRAAWSAARHRTTNMNTLIVVGTTAAYGASVVATFAPGLYLSAGVEPHLYYETAAAIVALVLAGRYLEVRARARTGDAIRALLALGAKSARVRRPGGAEEDVPIGSLAVGDVVVVRPGEVVAADGLVVAGSSAVDESLVSGESVPVEKSAGDEVIGGTLNRTGGLRLRVTRIGRESVLGQITRLVEEAQASKAPIQRLVDRVASIFVPVVFAIAAAAFVAWLALGPAPAFAHALTAFIAVLIIACPCALGLATPTAIQVGTGRGAARGILIRSAAALETARTIDVVAFDKTGTLTVGRPRLVHVLSCANFGEDELLRLVASAERGSEHPLAEAAVEAATGRGLALADPADVDYVAGGGVHAHVGPRDLWIGNRAFVSAHGFDAPEATTAHLEDEGQTPVLVAIDGEPGGILGFADVAKAASGVAVAELRGMGMRTVLLSGDARRTAEAIARRLGIDDVRAELRPDDKVAAIAAMQREGHRVAMVGDGVNDAPALAAADLGIAIGGGTDVAIAAAGIVLVGGDPRGVVRALRLSRRTVGTIRQNLFWAFAYNVALIPLAAGALYPFTGLLLSPVLAAVAMALSSVTVVSNSLRLRTARIG
ncbi:MAG: heavy metal translocating P-type ATPase [Candidatus Limnocylindria bacterium]